VVYKSQVRELSSAELRHPDSAVIDLPEGHTRLIWAFPTYSWGIPPVVAEVMKRARLGSHAAGAEHIMLTTCGDDMAYTDRQWRRIMHKRGLVTAGAYAVVMPNTYVLMKGFDVDASDIAAAKLEASDDAIDRIATQILSGNPADIVVRLNWSRVKSGIIYPWFIRYAMSARPFRSTEGCVSCGLCARSCPMDNIAMNAGGRPEWHDSCAMCLRCYHICPRHAVAYGTATDCKGQYLEPSDTNQS
ncbi:MAG: EFR1 family ferrodoxin, partial [Muribaculaceae bacterium]|nr:EFR1 family ferrodoxin [Muribaculaceae bacterium]